MLLRAMAAIALVTAAATAGQVAVFAGGLGDDHGDGTDTIFFGVVQDTRGAAVAGARVNLTYKKMSFVTTTDAIGGYRIAVPEIDADQSELSCRKDGYAQSAINRRPPASAEKAPIEIDCTLKKTP
jgi:hypothetical protein